MKFKVQIKLPDSRVVHGVVQADSVSAALNMLLIPASHEVKLDEISPYKACFYDKGRFECFLKNEQLAKVAELAEHVRGGYRLTSNDDCTVSLQDVRVADTADLPLLWIEKRKIAAKLARAFNEYDTLRAVFLASVKEVSVHPGTDKRGHPEYQCLVCGHRDRDRSNIPHQPTCPVGIYEKGIL